MISNPYLPAAAIARFLLSAISPAQRLAKPQVITIYLVILVQLSEVDVQSMHTAVVGTNYLNK